MKKLPVDFWLDNWSDLTQVHREAHYIVAYDTQSAKELTDPVPVNSLNHNLDDNNMDYH